MQSKAYLRYLRIAPRKVRMVADLIRGKSVGEAQTLLRFTRKGGSLPLLKLLNSATASGIHNFQLEPSNLYIAKITVDEGPKLKRVYPRAKGRADQIQKKTSHVTLVLDEKVHKSVAPEERKVEERVGKPRLRPAARDFGGQAKFRAEQETAKPAGPRKAFRMFRRKVI